MGWWFVLWRCVRRDFLLLSTRSHLHCIYNSVIPPIISCNKTRTKVLMLVCLPLCFGFGDSLENISLRLVQKLLQASTSGLALFAFKSRTYSNFHLDSSTFEYPSTDRQAWNATLSMRCSSAYPCQSPVSSAATLPIAPSKAQHLPVTFAATIQT